VDAFPEPPEALEELANIGIAISWELFEGRGSSGLKDGTVPLPLSNSPLRVRMEGALLFLSAYPHRHVKESMTDST